MSTVASPTGTSTARPSPPGGAVMRRKPAGAFVRGGARRHSFGGRAFYFFRFDAPALPSSPLAPRYAHTPTAKASTGRMSSVLNFYTDDSPGLKLSPVSRRKEGERARRAARGTPLPPAPPPAHTPPTHPHPSPGLGRHHVVRLHRMRDLPAHHRQSEEREEREKERGAHSSDRFFFSTSPARLRALLGPALHSLPWPPISPPPHQIIGK